MIHRRPSAVHAFHNRSGLIAFHRMLAQQEAVTFSTAHMDQVLISVLNIIDSTPWRASKECSFPRIKNFRPLSYAMPFGEGAKPDETAK